MNSPNILPAPPDAAEALARTRLRRGPIGQTLTWYATTTSTNDRALEAAASGAPHGSVVVAEAQSAGRGRLGHVWDSPEGAGLYVSVVVHLPGAAVPLLTIATGVAVADGIEQSTGLACQLKWPNDVWVDGRKLGGILAETVSCQGEGAVVVIGLGVNLVSAARFSNVADVATSIEGELGRPVDRGLVLAECLASLAERTEELATLGAAPVLVAWRRRAASLMGRRVEWDTSEGLRTGTALDVDAEGGLVVETASGRARIVAGEVRWR